MQYLIFALDVKLSHACIVFSFADRLVLYRCVCLLHLVFSPSLSLPSNLQLVQSYSGACPQYHKRFVCWNFAPYENAGQVRTLSRTFVLMSFGDKLETHCKECRINLRAGNRLCELLVGWLSLNGQKCCSVFFVVCAVSYCCTF